MVLRGRSFLGLSRPPALVEITPQGLPPTWQPSGDDHEKQNEDDNRELARGEAQHPHQPRLSTTASVSRCQIDRRSSHTTAQPTDRTGKLAFQQSQQGDDLAAFFFLTASSGGLAASLDGYSPKLLIEIWYGGDRTRQR
jgi:hypothetical protein